MNDKILHIKHEEGFYEGYTENLSYVDEEAIWTPCNPVTENGITTAYKQLITKELFVEAYNKWIKGTSNE